MKHRKAWNGQIAAAIESHSSRQRYNFAKKF